MSPIDRIYTDVIHAGENPAEHLGAISMLPPSTNFLKRRVR